MEENKELTQEQIDRINRVCDNIKVEVEPETPKERFEYYLDQFAKQIEENIPYIDNSLKAQKKIIDFMEDYLKKNPMQNDSVVINDEIKQKYILIDKLKEARKVEQARYRLIKGGFIKKLIDNYDFISDLNVFFKDAIGLDDYNDKIGELNGN